jgi:hypothetical protein
MKFEAILRLPKARKTLGLPSHFDHTYTAAGINSPEVRSTFTSHSRTSTQVGYTSQRRHDCEAVKDISAMVIKSIY